MIRKLVLFGATGDLARRFLFPALVALHATGQLREGFEVLGAAHHDLDDETFRDRIAQSLERHGGRLQAAAHEAIVHSLRYRRVDVRHSESVADVIRDAAGGREDAALAVYLALPPAMFGLVISALGATRLPAGSRVVLEKPFGEDLKSAIELNALLRKELGEAGERGVFRVDHVLGMATLQNLLGLRFANRLLENVWNAEHIEKINILWEETLAVEGRAAYYDQVGALKDVMQNHMLQVLSLVTMEPPRAFRESDLRDRKVHALRSIRQPTADDVTTRTRRARYGPGHLATTGGADGRLVAGYAEEHGVDPRRATETFAEVVLDLTNERWRGTSFLLRAGKAMAGRRKGVAVRFRPPSRSPFGDSSDCPPNELWIGIDGPEDVSLKLTGHAAGPPSRLIEETLAGEPPASHLPAYAHVLLDVLSGGSMLSVRGDEAEEAWRVLTPVLEGWSEGLVPLQEYAAGSSGP